MFVFQHFGHSIIGRLVVRHCQLGDVDANGHRSFCRGRDHYRHDPRGRHRFWRVSTGRGSSRSRRSRFVSRSLQCREQYGWPANDRIRHSQIRVVAVERARHSQTGRRPIHVTDDGTTLDFTSQTDFTGDTNPSGWEVGMYGFEPNGWGISAIFILADNCVVKGLDHVWQRGFGVQIQGDNNRVISCTISGSLYAGVKVQGFVGDPATGNIIGGTQPGEGNVLSGGNAGIRIDGPTIGTVVIGNSIVGSPYHGVEVHGAYCCPEYTPYDTRIGGPTPEERNWIANNGKYGEEGFPEGDQVHIEWAVDTLVEGNYIGTTEDGSVRFPSANGTAGVAVRESADTVIRDNLISGIRREGVNHAAGQVFGVGIVVSGLDTGVDIKGNRIGTDAAGQNSVPNLTGIVFGWLQGYPSNVQVGGPDQGDGNLIAFNERSGIIVANGVSDAAIYRNSIHSNGLLGIDLLNSTGQSGPSLNDPGDNDTGGNGLQNFPVLNSAESHGSSINVNGTFNSSPNSAFTLQFFANESGDPSGFGEGEQFLGETMIVTDSSGNAAFEVSLEASVPAGWVMTSTATREPVGATSEFSMYIPILPELAPDTFTINNGSHVSGSVSDLAVSDNMDLSVRRNPADVASRVFFEVQGISPTQSPASMKFTLEGSVFARSQVVQSIDLYNYTADSWEEIHSRDASSFTDSTTIAEATGDLSRFVQPETRMIEARCRFESPSQRQQFTANVDQTVWTIGN